MRMFNMVNSSAVLCRSSYAMLMAAMSKVDAVICRKARDVS
jgi:hypothetical protein